MIATAMNLIFSHWQKTVDLQFQSFLCRFLPKKERTQHVVVRLLFHALRYLDISQRKTMNLGAMLITEKFELQIFTISCQYHKSAKNPDI